MLKNIARVQVIMKTYCASCEEYTGNKKSNFRKTKQNRLQNRLMILSNCAVCGNKKSTFIKFTALMINLKWVKSLTNFYGLKTNWCQNCI